MRLPLCALGLLSFFALAADAAENLETLQTRPGVEQSFLHVQAERSRATLVLFAGGPGALRLKKDAKGITMAWGDSDFLVRTRVEFVRAGFSVATLDAPSDQQTERGMLGGFRAGAAHCQDVEAVVGWLRKRNAGPVWLVGTSRGTESVANCAGRLGRGIDGLILSSPITRPNLSGRHVTTLDLGKILVPSLIVVHEADECEHAPASGGHLIMSKLTQSPRKELKVVRGGERPRTKPCQGLSAHGFLGVESQVIDAIANFIRVAPRV